MSAHYGVYLVTDSTPALLGPRDLVTVVEAALRGGVTCVQYRDKECDDATATATARRLHALTRRWGVPLLVNDRVGVAVEVGCEGVHIGQDDMKRADIREAREMLGKDKIIGVSVSTADEAIRACEDGADYLGIGTVYSTSTKKNTKSIIGPSGVRAILKAMLRAGHGAVPTVCIGGINRANAAQLLASTSTAPADTDDEEEKSIDGLAVVSAIVAARDPAEAAREMAGYVAVAKIPRAVGAVARTTPLSHNMTNLVVQNFAANVALAIGASPIMSNNAAEAADLARLGGALVVNMGTVTAESLANYKGAIAAYNDAGRPIIFDPVGHLSKFFQSLQSSSAGATSVRRAAAADILAAGHLAIIKGNQAELQALHDPSSSAPSQRGVDSVPSSTTTSPSTLLTLAAAVARRHRAVVLLTGATDIVTDGHRAFRVDNGHPILARVTGTGCTLGTAVSAMVAACWPRGDVLAAVVAAAVVFGVAAQRAVGDGVAADRAIGDDGGDGGRVRGPGSFVPAFIDEIYAIQQAAARGDGRWMGLARVQAMLVDI